MTPSGRATARSPATGSSHADTDRYRDCRHRGDVHPCACQNKKRGGVPLIANSWQPAYCTRQCFVSRFDFASEHSKKNVKENRGAASG